ncbi:hypothetical protein LCGC14_3053950 [marine sediment metagenome]|uniref:Uncharacterized protein n=1 Tax=marine sediment metagenome TaxID=412755 RepID=A0A0F8ZBR0_9ZZZZ
MQLTKEEIEGRMSRLRQSEKVQEAMAIRCEENGHEYDGCVPFDFSCVYRECRWCGHRT